jgi:hypothetical protein
MMTELLSGKYSWSFGAILDGAYIVVIARLGVSLTVDSGVRYPFFVVDGCIIT